MLGEIHRQTPFFIFAILSYKTVHHNIMTQASPHDEQMKNFMGTEILMSGIKDWKLQGVDHATYRVNDTTSQKPAKSRAGRAWTILPKARTQTQPIAM